MPHKACSAYYAFWLSEHTRACTHTHKREQMYFWVNLGFLAPTVLNSVRYRGKQPREQNIYLEPEHGCPIKHRAANRPAKIKEQQLLQQILRQRQRRNMGEQMWRRGAVNVRLKGKRRGGQTNTFVPHRRLLTSDEFINTGSAQVLVYFWKMAMSHRDIFVVFASMPTQSVRVCVTWYIYSGRVHFQVL